MLDKIASLLGGGVFTGVNNLAKTFLGSRESRDTADADHTTMFLRGVANELQPRVDRTWWDSLIDGLNRIPRPAITGGVIYIFYFCLTSPVEFALAVQTLQLMPTPGWMLIGTVIGFWFTGKMIDGIAKRPRPIDPKALVEIIKARKEYEDSQPAVVTVAPQPDSDSIFASIREHVKDLDPEAALNKLLGKEKEKTNV